MLKTTFHYSVDENEWRSIPLLLRIVRMKPLYRPGDLTLMRSSFESGKYEGLKEGGGGRAAQRSSYPSTGP